MATRTDTRTETRTDARTQTRTRAAQDPILAALLLAASALALTLTAAPVLGAGLQDSAGQDASARADGDDAPRCVTIRTISGYSVIDDRHLLIQGGPSRQYLVTTRQRCSGMRFGVQIGLSFSDNERICQPHMEYIIPDDGWRCLIDTIEEVDSREHAEDLIARRAAEAEG
ncbi:MAG: hypothetical protein GC187_09690 [Alphaproteobacteria bacterium]|nr:hypothetical protein [Alphaproteobacteria bacterium]